jgi:hypothetical protein
MARKASTDSVCDTARREKAIHGSKFMAFIMTVKDIPQLQPTQAVKEDKDPEYIDIDHVPVK